MDRVGKRRLASLTLLCITCTMVRTIMGDAYRLSFTFGGLLFPESVAIAKRYQEIPDWDVLKAEAQEKELLRKTRSTSKERYFREIRDRFKQAWPFEIEWIANEKPGARYAALAVCGRYYRVVGDFIREVVRDKITLGEEWLSLSDYYHFLEAKTPLHPELTSLSETTRAKLRQVTFRMLTEGLLLEKGKEHRIRVPAIPDELAGHYIRNRDDLALEHLLFRRGA